MRKSYSFVCILLACSLFFICCNHIPPQQQEATEPVAKEATSEAPEYFNLRPTLEKAYGYTHAVKIGDDLKI
jgi:hypothetical protein